MLEAPIEFTVVTETCGFRELEEDWRRLSVAVDSSHFFQTFDWCWLAWECLAAKAGRRLRILVGKVRSRVVLILPLITAGPFLRILGSELFEFHDVLVLPDPQRDYWLQAAMNAAARLGGSALLLRDAREDGDLSAFIEKRAVRGRSRTAGKTSFIQLNEFADWESDLATLPKQLKSDQRRQWKRLAELPDPGRFEIVKDPDRQMDLLRWLHTEKSAWLAAHKGSTGGLFESAEYQDFFFSIVPILAAQGKVMMCRIVSGQDTMAGLLGFIHCDYFAFFMFAYDPKWATFSAGRLIMAKAIEWCFEHRLRTFDMLFGPEEYKTVWSKSTLPIRDYFVPFGLPGRFIEKWHATGCSRFFAQPWLNPIFRIVPGKLRRVVGSRLAAQRELIAEMRRGTN